MKPNVFNKVGVWLLLCFALFSVQQASAQTARKLTLDEAIQLGLQNSKQLKLNQAQIDEATASLREAKDDRLPDLKLSGSYLRLNNPNITLRTGGSSDSSGSGSSSSPKVSSAMYGMASLALPLYTGGKIKYGIESAKYLAEAAKLDAESNRDAVIQNTVNAYSNLYKSTRSVELVQQNLDQSRQRDRDFSNMEKNGLLARNDLLKSELQTSNVELTLLDAQRNRKMANVNMDLMLGLPEDTQLEVDSTGLDSLPDAKSVVEWEQAAAQNRKDVAALAARAKAANSAIGIAKADYLPTVALSGGYVAINIPHLAEVTNALNIGVGVSYNVATFWKTGAKVDKAKAQARQVEANQQALDDQMRLQINQAYEDYLLARKQIDVYNVAVEQANENYKITKNKHDNNLVTTTDLLDANVAQLQAVLNFAFSKADAAVAYKKLLQASGTLHTQYSNVNNNQ
ncbi:Outer membrane protein TolC [Chitinophaga costaii]|uniref:Outer membrane protein TolC n=1 Tax=Chitinophaga costaii TaxID=1335309 RepID=A0A1C4G259_9BACT|nr:TolC family protein [Chitinophaga costaii]PUZ19774.1 TolC family protein [Chitinophaga costaii]SCC62278.1 Outer membrane protein TolC [Chitinophaga costaii]